MTAASRGKSNDAPGRRIRPTGRMFAEFFERGGLILLLVVLCVFFAVNATSGPVFTGSANIKNILANQSVTALVALGMVIPLVSGYFDLSVSATAGVANVALASAIGEHGWPVWAGLVLVIGIGAFIGLANGFLVAKLELNGFVVTLGTYTLLGGLALLYTQGRLLTEGIPASFSEWGAEEWLGIPKPFFLLIVVAFIAWYVLAHTPFGRYLEAIGSNENAARLVGINTTRMVWYSFVLAGSVGAIAGALQTSRAGNGSAETGSAFLFPALTAVFLGATAIRPGKFNVWGTVIGVFFVAISVNGFSLLGAETWVQPVFNGGALITAVALTTFIARAKERQVKTVSEAGPAELPKSGSPLAEDAVARDPALGA